tara:strand:- start:13499 stop:13648 length:150 start_codon:yes stop_codon:yes gene_type:complete
MAKRGSKWPNLAVTGDWSFLALRTARMTIDADGGQLHLGGYVSAEAFRG